MNEQERARMMRCLKCGLELTEENCDTFDELPCPEGGLHEMPDIPILTDEEQASIDEYEASPLAAIDRAAWNSEEE